MHVLHAEHGGLVLFAVVEGPHHLDQVPAELLLVEAAVDAGQHGLAGAQGILQMGHVGEGPEALHVVGMHHTASRQVLEFPGQVLGAAVGQPRARVGFQHVIAVPAQVQAQDFVVSVARGLYAWRDADHEGGDGILPEHPGGHHVHHPAEGGIVAQGAPLLPALYGQQGTVDARSRPYLMAGHAQAYLRRYGLNPFVEIQQAVIVLSDYINAGLRHAV